MSAVRLTVDGGVAVLTLDRPEAKNAMSLELLDAFGARLTEVRGDATLRALVITGTGRYFCTGADFTALGGLAERAGAEGPIATQRAVRAMYEAFVAVDTVEIPVIAAVNGHAVGGGLGLMLQCDVRLVAEEAKIGANFAKLGIHSGLGITLLLPRLVGYEAAAEMLFTGELVSGARAAELGLARSAHASDDVLPTALDLARRMAAGAPLAVRAMKRTLKSLVRGGLAEVLQIEAAEQALLAQTKDAQEGIAAVIQKRDPTFEGR